MADEERVTPGPSASERTGPWILFAVLALLAAILTGVVVEADLDGIADPGWRDNALWAVGVSAGLLGVALAVTAWVSSGTGRRMGVARALVVLAVVGVTTALVVVVVADDRGGARAGGPPVDVDVTTQGGRNRPREHVLSFAEARDPQHIVTAALRIDERTPVTIDLTPRGRQEVARSMGCRPADLVDQALFGFAIGGTWAQPLLMVNPPADSERCLRAIVRLPYGAGTIRSGF